MGYILGSGLGEVFAGVFNEAPVELVDRLSQAEVDIPSLLGSNLDSLLTDSALSEFETNLSLFDSSSVTMEEITASRISAISEGVRVEVTGDNFNASFQDMLELLAGGGSNFDSFVDLIDGQITQIKTTDTSTGRSVSLNIINDNGDMDAERFFIEAEDASLELTGRLPRDIQDIKQLFDLASISEGEPGHETSLLSFLTTNHFEVEGLSLSSPNNELISIDNTGLRFTLPYEVLDDTLSVNTTRAIQLEVLGTVHQLEPLSAELDGISISDVILDNDGSLISTEDSLAISMMTDKWTSTLGSLS